MTKQKTVTTKEKLIEAAISLFAKHGIHWVSFQQIATKVGVSQPALYKHFKDKDDLILACALSAVEAGRQIIDQHVDPHASALKQLKSYIEGQFIWAQKQPEGVAVILAIHYFCLNQPAIKELVEKINTQSCYRIGVRISSGQHEGYWQSVDREATARAVHNLLFGEIVKAIQSPREMSWDKRVKFVWSMTERLLGE
jgi:AcrR family transcriptional regulator